MAQFREKPTVVDAVFWHGEPDAAIERWLGADFNSWIPSRRGLEFYAVDRQTGCRRSLIIAANEWIVRDAHGELFWFTKAEFAQRYEPADDAAALAWMTCYGVSTTCSECAEESHAGHSPRVGAPSS
jgi:hypothetical protein